MGTVLDPDTPAENVTEAANVYSDIWRLHREGQGIFKLTEAEVRGLSRLVVGDVREVVETFRTLAEENRKRYEETDGEEGDLGAANAYEDAANHLEQELLPDDDVEPSEEVQRKASRAPTPSMSGDEDDDETNED